MAYDTTIFSRILTNVLDCDIIESMFELRSSYYTYFQTNTLQKGMNSFFLPAMG